MENLTKENVAEIIKRIQASGKLLSSYFKIHIHLAARYRKDLLPLIIKNLLRFYKKKIITAEDLFSIFHNKEDWDGMRMSCLNTAVLNRDTKNAEIILEIERIIHSNQKLQLMTCVRENVHSDELKPMIAELCKKDNAETSLNTNSAKLTTFFKLFLETVIISELPYIWDTASDIQLDQTFQKLSYGNQTWQTNITNSNNLLNTDETPPEYYKLASQITKSILYFNGLVYLAGILRVKPTWISDNIARYKTKLKWKDEYFYGYGVIKYGWAEDNRIPLEKLEKLKSKTNFSLWMYLVMFYCLYPFARLLWPILILLPHQYINKTAKTPSLITQARNRTETFWMIVKVLEASLENVLQLCLQVWLLLPLLNRISQLTWFDLAAMGGRGALSIISFGFYQPPEMIEVSLGKILFTMIMLSFGHAMMKLQKPGLGIGSKLKVLPVLFFSILLQVISRLYSFRNLLLMETEARLKYGLFLGAHILILMAIKVTFEARRKENWTGRKKPKKLDENKKFEISKNSWLKKYFQRKEWTCLVKTNDRVIDAINNTLHKLSPAIHRVSKVKNWIGSKLVVFKRMFLLVLSCMCSTVLMVDLHWQSSRLHYPKHNLISHLLFYILILTENIILTTLPFAVPSMFPGKDEFNHSSFTQAIIVVNISYIIAVLLEVTSNLFLQSIMKFHIVILSKKKV